MTNEQEQKWLENEQKRIWREEAELLFRTIYPKLNWVLPENIGATAVERANFREGFVAAKQSSQLIIDAQEKEIEWLKKELDIARSCTRYSGPPDFD